MAAFLTGWPSYSVRKTALRWVRPTNWPRWNFPSTTCSICFVPASVIGSPYVLRAPLGSICPGSRVRFGFKSKRTAFEIGLRDSCSWGIRLGAALQALLQNILQYPELSAEENYIWVAKQHPPCFLGCQGAAVNYPSPVRYMVTKFLMQRPAK